MTYTITVDVKGHVTKAEIVASTMPDEAVRTCTITKIKTWVVREGGTEPKDVTFSVSFTG